MLNYDELIPLDAEDLAEGGIASAYEQVRARIVELTGGCEAIEEVFDEQNSSYEVKFRGQTYRIYGEADRDEGWRSWANATYALFAIVNAQLEASTTKLFAINGGNDLGGLFLTVDEAEASRRELPRPEDWPYLPSLEVPWFGQHHS